MLELRSVAALALALSCRCCSALPEALERCGAGAAPPRWLLLVVVSVDGRSGRLRTCRMRRWPGDGLCPCCAGCPGSVLGSGVLMPPVDAALASWRADAATAAGCESALVCDGLRPVLVVACMLDASSSCCMHACFACGAPSAEKGPFCRALRRLRRHRQRGSAIAKPARTGVGHRNYQQQTAVCALMLQGLRQQASTDTDSGMRGC